MVRQREGTTIDWHAVHDSAEFRRLTAVRGRFVRGAVVVLLAWFAVFLLVVGAAPGLAGTVVFAGMSVGFLLGLSQFVLAWLLTWRYLRLSDRVFCPLEADVVAAAEASSTEPGSAAEVRP